MFTIFVGLVVFSSLLMCAIVVIQKSKGGGLASGFASSNRIMGVKKTTNFLENATWILAICMALFSIFASKSLPTTVVADESIIMQNVLKNNNIDANLTPDMSESEITNEVAE